MKIREIMEGDVVRTKFATKQAQRGLDKYKPVEGIEIPVFDRAVNRSMPPDLAEDPEKFASFYAIPSSRSNAAYIMGVRDNGEEHKTSTTGNMELADALADAYNRGGFSAQDIRRVPIKGFDESRESGISAEDLANVLYDRLEQRYPEIVSRYGHGIVGNAIMNVAEFHAGAEELGTSDISIMLKQVLNNLEHRLGDD